MDAGDLNRDASNPDDRSPAVDRRAGRWMWLALALPCLFLLAAAFLEDRADWRALAAGEGTAIVQAESLRLDGDLAYERLDFERHVVTRYGLPPELALVSGTGGRLITYDSSAVFGFIGAAGLTLFGEWGFVPAHALLFVVALAAAACLLRGRVDAAPARVAVLAFMSVAFAAVFRATPDVLLFAASALAAALCVGAGTTPRRWLVAGVLLSLAVFTRWQHVVLLVPFVAAAPDGMDRSEAWSLRLSVLFGLLIGLGAQAVALFWVGGGLGSVDSVRFVFTPASGFPLVDVPTQDWGRMVEKLGALYFDGAPRFDWGLEPSLVGRNALYWLAGQSFGFVPYLGAPLALLALGVRRRVAVAWGLGLGVVAVLAIALEPFHLAGADAVGNPRALPWLAASILWWRAAPSAAQKKRWGLAVTVALLVSAPFLSRLWLAPGTPPLQSTPTGFAAGHTTALARGLLPYEWSQQALPSGPAYDHSGLRVKLLSTSLREKDLDVLTLTGERDAHLWVASPEPLAAVRLAFGQSAPATVELIDPSATLLDRELRADGGVTFRIQVPGRQHGMWWSPRPQFVYRVDFRLPGAGTTRLDFTLTGETVRVGGIR